MRTIKNILIYGTLLVMILLLGACGGGKPADTDGQNGTEEPSDTAAGSIELQTSDGYTIKGNFVAAEGDGKMPACLLVHQLGLDKSTYTDFQNELALAGISSLAIDMRGHGESTGDGVISYRDFKDDDWQDVANDFIAGLDHLRSMESVDASKIGIVGASIAANLTVTVTADEISEGKENPPKCIVLLSPGLIYRGIRPTERAREIRPTPVYLVSAREDEGSYRGSQSLSQATRSENFIEYEGSDHGTDLFDAHPELMGNIIEWLSDKFGI